MNASVSLFSRAVRVFVFILFVGLVLAGDAAAHTLQTKKKCNVLHYHFTTDCVPGVGCGKDWAKVEKLYGFKSADRIYVGTSAWNCHGRTFDNRRSWVDYADPFLKCDGPVCPAKPQVGDAIVWYNNNGTTKHSVTIVGAWKSLDTLVMSKYGVAGQYKHALRNSVAAYGSRYTVTRFTAGTAIYSNAVDDPQDIESGPRDSAPAMRADELLAAREQMPWFDSVREAEEVFAQARAEHIQAVGALLPETIESLASIQDTQIRVQLLINDIHNREHYVLLGAYNAPEPELISGMESARLLREIAEQNDTSRAIVTDYLVTLANQIDAEDAARAVALTAVSPLLSADARQELFDSVTASTRTDTATYAAEALRAMRAKFASERHKNER